MHSRPTPDPGRPQAPLDLSTPLSVRAAFLFPLQSRESRREVVLGGLILLLPLLGWLLNMGHRIALVHAMQEGASPWPAWHSWRALLRYGFITWLGMLYYYAPGVLCVFWSVQTGNSLPGLIGVFLMLLATLAIPGYMTHYCKRFDPSEIFNPFKALRRSVEAGRHYWQAWMISLLALLLSFFGLLAFGIGFLFTSVWFWQVAGYSFSNAFTTRHALLATTAAKGREAP